MTERVPAKLLDGRVVIITGAARGVGSGIAEAVTARGGAALLVDRDARLLGETAEQLSAAGRRVIPLAVDLRAADAHSASSPPRCGSWGPCTGW